MHEGEIYKTINWVVWMGSFTI